MLKTIGVNSHSWLAGFWHDICFCSFFYLRIHLHTAESFVIVVTSKLISRSVLFVVILLLMCQQCRKSDYVFPVLQRICVIAKYQIVKFNANVVVIWVDCKLGSLVYLGEVSESSSLFIFNLHRSILPNPSLRILLWLVYHMDRCHTEESCLK